MTIADAPLLWLPLAALALDLLAGDPAWWPHPVRALGWLATRLERFFRGLGLGKTLMRLAGVLGVLLVAGAGAGAAYGLSVIPFAGPGLALYLAYAGLALGCLLREGKGMTAMLARNDLEDARQGLAMLVSRDVAHLDRSGMGKTLAETLSENLCDGLVAPAFWLCIGGPWGVAVLWAYKGVSTLDSMWGYRTERFRDLGWAAARLDDVLAWVPARLTAMMLFLVGTGMGCFKGGRILKAWRNMAAQARQMESPNAGWPMASAAWCLGATLGGPAIYAGRVRQKPVLGPEEQDPAREWDEDRLKRLLTLLRRAGIASVLLLAPAGWGLWLLVYNG